MFITENNIQKVTFFNTYNLLTAHYLKLWIIEYIQTEMISVKTVDQYVITHLEYIIIYKQLLI